MPALRMWLSIDERAPVPIATMTITAATPMIMPSAVERRAHRIAAQSAFTATLSVTSGDIYADLSSDGARTSRVRRRATAASSTALVAAHAAVAKGDDARRVLGDVGLVRHEHDGDAALG